MIHKRNILTLAVRLGVTLGIAAALQLPAAAHHRRHHHAGGVREAPLDLSPVVVRPYLLPDGTDPHRANFLRRMHLENGAEVRGTRDITDADVTNRDLFILQITQSLEGGFDSVNMYDRGVLSWGIMQWTAHAGSLHQCLMHVKRRLLQDRRKALWDKVFVAQGLDVDADHILVYGKPITDPNSARLAFRGSTKPGNYDPKLVTHWATVFARAGRQPEIAALQGEYAGKVVDGLLEQRLEGLPYHAPGRAGLTVADLAGDDPYAEALVFALWTNNPRHALGYVAQAARAARGVSVSDDPSLWAPGAFSEALLRLCRASRFGNWRQRAAMIEVRAQEIHSAAPGGLTPFERQYQVVLAARKQQRAVELASRHRDHPRTTVTAHMEQAEVPPK